MSDERVPLRYRPGYGPHGKRVPGHGSKYYAKRKIVCAFDEDTFDAVRVRAVKAQVSIAEIVRQLVEDALSRG